MQNKPLKIILSGEIPASWNRFYAGMHWTKRRAEAERVHWLVRAAIPDTVKMYSVPVQLIFRAYFPNRRRILDASNICVKLYEDGLKGILIEDDAPQFVRSVCAASFVDKKNPRLEIEIIPVSDDG